jgi:GxxExxY protein
MQEPGDRADPLAAIAVDAAIQVHCHLGPAFLENVYEKALCHELRARAVPFERQLSSQSCTRVWR